VLFSQQFVFELTLTYERAIQRSTGVFKIEKNLAPFHKCGTFGRYFGILLRIIDLFRLIASIKKLALIFLILFLNHKTSELFIEVQLLESKSPSFDSISKRDTIASNHFDISLIYSDPDISIYH
jgi:hypothetical protein